MGPIMKECFIKVKCKVLMEFLSLLMDLIREEASKNPKCLVKDILSTLKELLDMKEIGLIISLMAKAEKNMKMGASLVADLRKG